MGPGERGPDQGEVPVRYRPGRAGWELFSSLVDRALPSWSLEGLRFSDAAITFSVSKQDLRLDWELLPPAADPNRSQLRNANMALRPGGDRKQQEAGPKPDAQAGALFRVFGAAPFAGLCAKLKADGLLHSDPQAPQPQARLERFFRAEDHGRDWWRFFYPRKPFLEEEVVLGDKVAVVSHATSECRANGPQRSLSSLRLFADDRLPRSRRDVLYYDTDINEKDVAQGRTLTKLNARLSEVASTAKPGFIHLMTTCLPELVGDDPQPFIKKLQAETGTTVVWTSKTRDPGISFNDVVLKIVSGVRFKKKRDPRSVILAGTDEGRSAAEMTRILSLLGLKVAARMFPYLDIRGMPGVPSASALVWVDPVGWERFHDDHFIKSGLDVVRYHPPYGLQGTKAWLSRVASVLGRDMDKAGAVEAGHAKALAELRSCMAGKTAVLVGDRSDLEAMVLRGQPMGFSPAAVLAEMGLKVRCFVYEPDPGAWGAEPRREGGVGFEPFRTRAELSKLLADGVELAFSHLNHDPRLSAAGVAGFCEADFEVGVEGFLRAGHRLLKRVRTMPLPRHRRFLPL
ncbi:MAG: hypothetical protein HY924_00745 [Elusimicrobia bacterium]|nr:hypothetical protein [Elusimicrobiota bacterium]